MSFNCVHTAHTLAREVFPSQLISSWSLLRYASNILVLFCLQLNDYISTLRLYHENAFCTHWIWLSLSRTFRFSIGFFFDLILSESTQMFDVCSVHRVGRFNVILKLCFVWFFSDQRHSSTHIYWILFENICRRALKFMRKQNDFSVSDFLRFFVLFIWLYVHCRLRQSWLQQYFSLKIRKKRWIGFSLEIPTVYQIKMQKPKED